jgi:aquaporin Z
VGRGSWARVFNLRFMTESEKRTIDVRRLVAEAIGTFTLTLVACSTEVVPAVLNQPPDDLVAAVAPGLTVLVVICAIGNVSGAHINPVVTFAFAFRRAFPWRRVPAYLVAQVLGAAAAGWMLRALVGPASSLGVNTPHIPPAQAVFVELLLTALLVTVILSVSTRESLTGTNAALPVGFTIMVDGFIGGPLTGASMNPARSLGPVLAGGPPQYIWIYLVGPALGALTAVVIVYVVHGKYSEAEVHDAVGDSTKGEEERAGPH